MGTRGSCACSLSMRPMSRRGALPEWRQRRETDLPAEPTRAQAAPRLSQTHGDPRRNSRSRPSPGQRAQASFGLSIAPRQAAWAHVAFIDDALVSSNTAGHSRAARSEVEMRLNTLKKSVEFRRVRGGLRSGTDSFLIEGKSRQAPSAPAADGVETTDTRFGFTITKKLGGAVVRNKIRRRLKSVVRALDADTVSAGYDYVVVARRGVLAQPYVSLAADFRRALEKIHRATVAGPATPQGPRVQADSASNRSSVSDPGAHRASKQA